ncbi:ATP-binding response regulator, partial [Rickettsiella grylli]|uniref:ATP-binding response regulator n=1 Tax=Rickettsiella grylli TaxID=59196 RepID=UPI000AEC9CC9
KSGEIIGVLGVSIDITELKKTQKKLKKSKLLAETANQAKTKFLASMSHDIRTPLAGIIGLSKILQQRLNVLEDKNDLLMIGNASNQLLRLLTNILDVASLENASDLQLKIDNFSIQELAESLQKLLLPSIKSKGLTLQLNVDVSFTGNIASDQSKLERILLNLATNAIKFTEKGKVTISIKELNLPRQLEGTYIEFMVTDTGIGIPPEQLTSIFDPFFRIEPSHKKSTESSGYGIGLYTVKKFVRLLGGEIHVKSQMGAGTSFFFTLLMKLAPHNQRLKVKNKTKNVQPFVFLDNKKLFEIKKFKETEKEIKKNILLIEDDHLTIKFSKELFAQAAYNLTVISTLQETIAFAKNHAFDLIITDLGLPGLRGNEIAVLYRYWERINKKPMVPIISLTA